MKRLTRRSFLALGTAGLLPLPLRGESPVAPVDVPASRRLLPMSTIFKGGAKFEAIVAKAGSEGWARLSVGERLVKAARELEGQPYVNFTLEIDDRIESPSVNLEALDCWTFFEQCLGLARMLGRGRSAYTPEDLLREIEFTRYRAGRCSGNYLERIHFLAEWYFDNEAKGTCRHLTPSLPGAERIHGRKVTEMTALWKSYRYLRNNPELLPPMREIQEKVAQLPVYHVPKGKVAAIEPELRNGDVIGIATKYHGAFCSHVGIVVRTEDGVARFMHASRNYRKVVVDKSVSGYLADFSAHAGILVGRPLEISETVTDGSRYESALKELLG